ncbi:DUF614 domain protein [Aspergillus candidus]|uniref:PLAC8-domain-containing protein n=1 Tax=Aspergillus candidus TaxID=41067 RepID=A0A2I2FBP4_ASPCN|nr:PLAC8-domain-containing protein [Aspergillus candidus]PLB38033.1 PLAC8-domain-containing protein [Aspergillus candidus]
MSRGLHLDTNFGANPSNPRYSFLETPLEMHAPGQQSFRTEERPPQSLPPQQTERPTVIEETPQPVVDEKAHSHHGPEPRSPDIQQHPANYAPFADEVPLSRQPQQAAPDYPYGSPPSSPGPLPIKTGHEIPDHASRLQIAPVVPDANPLQSPQLAYFPPPTATEVPRTPAPGNMLAYHQPGQATHPNQEIQGGTWSHSLCDCSNIWTCCIGLFCPCILYGRTQYRLSRKSRKEDPTNMLGYETCNGSCTGMALLCGCQWLMATIQHSRTRKAYGIQGDIMSDCVRATCCTCCTLIQDESEIRKREEDRAKAAQATGAALVSPYSAPLPMTYGPAP